MIDDELASEIKKIYSEYHAGQISADDALNKLEIAITESSDR